MRTKKGSLSLSINAIVIIIISMVIMSSGIMLLFQAVGSGEAQFAAADEAAKAKLANLLDEGKQVALPQPKITILRGESKGVPVGVLNTDEKQREFEIRHSFSTYTDRDDEIEETKPANSPKFLYDTDPFTLDSEEKQLHDMQVSVPKKAKRGEYIFSIRVCNAGTACKKADKYGNLQKLVIIVK